MKINEEQTEKLFILALRLKKHILETLPSKYLDHEFISYFNLLDDIDEANKPREIRYCITHNSSDSNHIAIQSPCKWGTFSEDSK